MFRKQDIVIGLTIFGCANAIFCLLLDKIEFETIITILRFQRFVDPFSFRKFYTI